MNDRELFRLMQLIPEEYPEEAADFLAAHGKTVEAGKTEPVIRQKKAEPQAGILWRILLPAGAAACLAVLIGAGIWTGLQEKPLTTASSEPELTEIALQSETVPAQTAAVTAAVQQTETKTVTQSAVQTGTAPAVQSSISAVTAAAEDKPQTTARQQQAKPQTTAAPQQQTVPETTVFSVPARDPDYLPGDVNMNGEVEVGDVQLLLTEYEAVVVNGKESTLTPQQIALGDIYPNTADEDPLEVMNRFGFTLENDDTNTPIIATDYPISYQDVHILLCYYTEFRVPPFYRDYDLFTVDMYVQYGGIPPREELERFMSPPTILQGDALPADSVTVQDFGDYPVHPEGWAMQYAKLKKSGDFTLWYDGTDALAGCRIMISGENNDYESTMYFYIRRREQKVLDGQIEKAMIGDTAVYRYPQITPEDETENWREEDKVRGRTALEWTNGEYWITVYTQEQYPDDVIQQIAECFAAYPTA